MRAMSPVALLLATALLGTAACEGGEEAEDAPMQEEPRATPDTGAQQTGAVPMPAQMPEGVTEEMVSQGQQVFTGQGFCYTCHGQDARGTSLAPDLTDDQWLNVDGEYENIVQVVRTGVPDPEEHPSPMPAMGGAQLSEEQVRSVAAYVYAISHANGGS